MKKLLMILILLLGVGGLGAGYYLFYMKPKKDAELARAQADAAQPQSSENMTHPEKKITTPSPQPNTKFFVNEHRLGVRNSPDSTSYPVRYLYKGDPVTIIEQKNGWGRISSYFVYQQGGPEIAEWVPIAKLSTEKPKISKQEKEEIIMSYIGQSDDLKLYKEKFIQMTGQLIHEKICTPEDFSELKGWVRSVKYKDRHVYFIYCGGLKTINKIYFDVDKNEIFYR
jgi:SH3-like domain-containing protein